MYQNDKKYKLTLLKDLPGHKAGTEIVNITGEELNNNCAKSFSEIFELHNNPEWVLVEEDPRCDCLTKEQLTLKYVVVGYGRKLLALLSFKNKEISIHYDHACDNGTTTVLKIANCPLCGRKL